MALPAPLADRTLEAPSCGRPQGEWLPDRIGLVSRRTPRPGQHPRTLHQMWPPLPVGHERRVVFADHIVNVVVLTSSAKQFQFEPPDAACDAQDRPP